jgi:tetratricopeptide (TPR) repeat protein
VAWFRSDDLNELHDDYLEFAKTIGYVENDHKKDRAVQYVKDWLFANPGWLLIFDDVNKYEEIAHFLPDGGGHIIITSRNRNWPSKFIVHPIDVMTEQDATALVKVLLRKDMDAEELQAAKALSKSLGFLPLALAQAGSYIQQNQMTIVEYLDIYKKYELKLLTEDTLPEGSHSRTIAVTWNVTLDAIAKKSEANHTVSLALELLQVCSYLSQEKIPEAVLLQWLKTAYPNLESPDLVLNKEISQLWQFSIINRDDLGNITLHPLVQSVVREQHQQFFKKIKSASLSQEWFDTILKVMHQEFHHKAKVTDTEKRQKALLTHLQALLKYHDLYWPAQFSDHFGNMLLDMATVLHVIGDNQTESIICERALQMYTKQYGKKHQKVAVVLRHLGDAYKSLERSLEAKKYLEEALSIHLQCPVQDNLEIATTLVELSGAVGDLGDAQQKKVLLE